MKRIIFILPLLVLSFSILYSQTTQKQIAVLNLSAAGLSRAESITLTDRLRSELVNTHQFRVIERDKMEEILTEQGLQQSGCTTDECAVEIGKLLNIHQICAGSVGKVGSLYTVILRLIDVESGQILATVTEDCSCPIEQVLTGSMRNIALKLVEETNKYPGLFVTKGGSGDLYLKSSLSPAKIFIDGQLHDEVTPATIKNLPSGEHLIKVVKDDYAGSRVVIINPNEILEETVEMSKARGGLKVYSDPPEADIYVEDQYQGRTPKIIQDITAGEYLLLLRKTDYGDIKRRIKVNGEEFTEVDITMFKPAVLSVTSEPVNAAVRMFGQETGKTPLQMNDIYPGKVYVEIFYPGYKTEGEYVQLNEASLTSKHYVLKKLPSLLIESNPVGASVYINGSLKGVTPIEFSDLTEDKIKLVIKKNYYNDWQKELILQSGKDEKIDAILTSFEGLLSINSDPSGLLVSANGQKIGKTPLELKKPYGEYEITISDARFETIREQLILNVPEIQKNYNMIYLKGSIKINGLPAGADISVDGKEISPETSEFILPVGPHTVCIEKSGFKNMTVDIELQSEQIHSMNVVLMPKRKTDAFFRSLVIPGWGQAYQEKTVRAWIYPMAVLGLGTTSFIMTNKYNDKVDNYNEIRRAYSEAFDPDELNRLRQQMDDAYKQVEESERIRNIFYVSTGLVWIWNILDTIILPPDWETNIKPVSDTNGSIILIGLSINMP